jgi:hypothetical protein
LALAGDKEDLEYTTYKLKENYEKWGLDMYLNKTKYLCTVGTHNNLKLDEDKLNFVKNIMFCSYF